MPASIAGKKSSPTTSNSASEERMMMATQTSEKVRRAMNLASPKR